MKLLLTTLLTILITSAGSSQPKYVKDTESIESTIEALYASISGEKGEERDWDRFRNLFIPEAKLMPTGINQEGIGVYRVWGVEEYIPRVNQNFLDNGFIENGISNEIERFRNIAHVFSTYESRNTKKGELIARGINSIQLFYDNARWWIVSVYWASENPDNPIPEGYLNN